MNKIIHGDCLKELKKLKDNSVDCLVTDPPYGYSFMGKDWDKAVPSVEIWKECLRVLKPGAFAFIMSAPRSDVLSRMIVRIEDAGFRVDFSPIAWTFASGFPKALNVRRKILKDLSDALTAQHGIINVVWRNEHAESAEEPITSHSPTPPGPSADASVWPLGTHKISEEKTIGTGAAGKSVTSVTPVLGTSIETGANGRSVVVKSATLTLEKSVIPGVETLTGEEELPNRTGSLGANSVHGGKRSTTATEDSVRTVAPKKNSTRTTLSSSRPIPNSGTPSATEKPSATDAITHYTVSYHGRELVLEKHDDGTFSIPDVDTLEGSYGGFQPKPAWEMVIVAMKPLSEKTYVDQALKNGKGVTWLDDCRVPTSEGLNGGAYADTKNKVGGIYGKLDYDNGEFKQPTGRFPANLLVSDDVLNDGRIIKSTVRRTDKQSDGIFGKFGNTTDFGGDAGSYSRFFDLDVWAKTLPFLIVPKASKGEKNEGLDGFPVKVKQSMGSFGDQSNVSQSDGAHRVGNKGESESRNHHPTVKPLKLMAYLITLGSRPGDVVLDPFLGSGTTALAAKNLGRSYIGIEREAEYVKIGKARLKNAPPVQPTLIAAE